MSGVVCSCLVMLQESLNFPRGGVTHPLNGGDA